MKRRLSAIMSADAVGYSRHMSQDDVGTVELLSRCHELMSDVVGDHGGRVVDSPGDNLLAEFESVVGAVEAAVEVQRALGGIQAGGPAADAMSFRIGPAWPRFVQEISDFLAKA